jgi:trypsin
VPAVRVGGSGSPLRHGALALLVAVAGALVPATAARAADTSPDASAAVERNRASELDPRIVGGHQISIAQAPWQAALTLNPAIYAGNGAERQFCGASVVAPRLLISAAHCMVDPRTNTLWADGELAAITGRTQLSSNEGQEIVVSEIFVFRDPQGNPLYTGSSSAWDISLVVLAQPSAAPSIKIPGPDETELWSLGRRVDVTGWGATSFEGPSSDFLLSAEMAVLRDETCERPLGLTFNAATSLCSGVYAGKRDSCQGDSGGPLTAPTADGGARLVGNVQSGFECARALIPAAYGRFGAETVRNALQAEASRLVGADIVGSGAAAPSTLTRNQAIELTLSRADDQCEKLKGCDVRIDPNRCRTLKSCPSINARQCKARGPGFRCQMELFARTRRAGKSTCVQSILWTANTGTIERENLGKRKCSDGW